MKNKKIWWIVAVIVIVILLVIGIYFYNKHKTPSSKVLTREEFNNLLVNASTGADSDSRAALMVQSRESSVYVQNMDKTKCSELEDATVKNNCINAIDLTERALEQKYPMYCYNQSYQVNNDLRTICFIKSQGVKKNA
jgi:hypothetical protein